MHGQLRLGETRLIVLLFLSRRKTKVVKGLWDCTPDATGRANKNCTSVLGEIARLLLSLESGGGSIAPCP